MITRRKVVQGMNVSAAFIKQREDSAHNQTFFENLEKESLKKRTKSPWPESYLTIRYSEFCGRTGEFIIWATKLSLEEDKLIEQGHDPLKIRSESIIFCGPIFGGSNNAL